MKVSGNKNNVSDSDEDDLLMGQENIDESGIVEPTGDRDKKMDKIMDFEQKKNNLYDSDSNYLDEDSGNFIE